MKNKGGTHIFTWQTCDPSTLELGFVHLDESTAKLPPGCIACKQFHGTLRKMNMQKSYNVLQVAMRP